MQHLTDTIDRDRIVHFYEANWLVWPNGLLTSAEREQVSVQIRIDGDDEASLTVIATITSSRCKLSLQIPAEWLAERVHSTQIGDIGGI
jgi:hypothetical protein